MLWPSMTRILVIKTGALGDVLRTTSILRGLVGRHPSPSITWVTAYDALPLIEDHPLIHAVEGVEPEDAHEMRLLARRLSNAAWDRVLSFDDEQEPCRLASAVPLSAAPDAVLTGAYLDSNGRRVYTDDAAAWFDMGLISRFGKAEADRLKVANRRTHPAIFAEMVGVPPGAPGLYLNAEARAFASEFARHWELESRRPLVGLNTGAGGRWRGKGLSTECTIELAKQVAGMRLGDVSFLLLGGPDERERNRELLAGLRSREPRLRVIDAGTDNPLQEFAALVGLVDVLVTSDSLAMHVGIALERPVVVFFAPTSAAEIELYGLGCKVESTAPDYCSYEWDADNSTITPERLCAGVIGVLGR